MAVHTWKDWYGKVHNSHDEPMLGYYNNLTAEEIKTILIDRLSAVGAIKHKCCFVRIKDTLQGYYGESVDWMVTPCGKRIPNRLDAFVEHECQNQTPSYWHLLHSVGLY